MAPIPYPRSIRRHLILLRHCAVLILAVAVVMMTRVPAEANEFALLLEPDELSLTLPEPLPRSFPVEDKQSTPDRAAETSDEPNRTESLADEFQQDANRLEVRLAALRKPAGQLTLVPDVLASDDPVEPVNQAATLFATDSPQWISGQWLPIIKAERVHTPFCHRPTYFQELNLERCGRTDCESIGCLQNACSSFWFLTNAALLPFRSVTQSPCLCVPAYGDGNICQASPIPIEPLGCRGEQSSCTRGALLQAASMAGFAFLVF